MSILEQKVRVELNVKERCALRDRQLVIEAQAGSSAAFAHLQSIYHRQLYSTVVSITRNREDAEDALQDTFMRAYMALQHFEGRSSVYSWLTRIAINSALMILRRRRVRSEILFDSHFGDEEGGAPPEVKDTSLNPEQVYDQRQRSLHLLRSVERLEPKLRAPIEIQLMHDCSMKDIAQRLGISVAAVKARLHRARCRLSTRHFRKAEHLRSGLTSGEHNVSLLNREQPCMG